MYVAYASPEYLRAAAAHPAIRQLKERSLDLMQIQGGHRVLELGCGPAINTIPIARRVGPSGTVIGVDNDMTMVAEANLEAWRAGVGAWTSHRHAETTMLPFPDSYFDSCYSERLFQHLTVDQCVKATREALRVTKPGGRVVIADTDWGSLSVDCDDTDLERRIVRAHADRFMNGYSGRRSCRLLRQQGALDCSLELFGVSLSYANAAFLLAPSELLAVQTAAVTPAELTRWRATLAQANAYGVFHAHVTMTVAAGRRAKGG